MNKAPPPTPSDKPPAHKIPELQELIGKYGVTLGEKPLFVIVGSYYSKDIGPVMGILAACQNEFHAHILKREMTKNGSVSIERTEYHPDGCTFNISAYYKKMKELRSTNG